MQESKTELFAIFDATPGQNQLLRIGPATLEEAKDAYRSIRARYPTTELYLVPFNTIAVDDG